MKRRLVLTLLLPLLLPCAALAAPALDAPNVVPISPHLVTSGQPTPAALAGLGAAGFQAVIYLAPSNVSNAVPNEAELLRRQGIEFVHIPIPFGSPEPQHVQTMFAAMHKLQGKKVLVHCEVNMRASSMTFMYRAIVLGEDPVRAYADVTTVWSPRGPWRKLIEQQLRQAGVSFELL